MKIGRLFLCITLIYMLLWQCESPEVNEATADKIDRLMRHAHENGMYNGTILVAQNGRVIYRMALGYADFESERSLVPESSFYLASVSKQFTTMAIMLLAQQGQLSFENRLSDFFPDFPAYATDVTIRHLMTHTSGIPDHYRLNAYKPGLTNEDVYQLLIRQDSLDFAPGERYSYSNGGYVLLAMIVEKVAQQPYHEFMRQQIFNRLQMDNTLVFDESEPHVNNRAIGYNAMKGLDDYEIFTTGAGGMYSTIDDLYKWDQALYTEDLISSGALREAFTSYILNNGEPTNYGFGWSIDGENNAVQHSGGLNGFRTYIKRFLDQQSSYIMLTNQGDAVAMYEVRTALDQIIQGNDFDLPGNPYLDAAAQSDQ